MVKLKSRLMNIYMLPVNSKMLIVDCYDLQYTFPYLRNGFNVISYETDELLLNGGSF